MHKFILIIALFMAASCHQQNSGTQVKSEVDKPIEENILFYEVNPKEKDVKLYWKNSENKVIGNFDNLKNSLQKRGKTLLFAMNAGMYLKDQSPQGLYIEEGKILKRTDTVQKAYGNFYMQPNGVFYITQGKTGHVVQTSDFKLDSNIQFSTQSGPMLLINGEIHPKFKDGSTHLNIRNGVGVLPNSNLLFAMSKSKINFFNFATFFKSKDCENALYLDGFVSKTYLPSKKWNDTGGEFGVLIGVSE
jgi:uncharacterized protein YigE (DUF2233 family)